MEIIVLTSCGIIDTRLKEKFLSLFSKNHSELKVLYIPTAADSEDMKKDREWIEEEFNTIINLGIKKENITEYRMDYELDVDDYDFIYMMGGNTFYLLSKIREYGFDKKIVNAIKNGIIYVGSSAGSIIMGNTIETACDENKYLTDFKGLGLINGIIIPHANNRKDYINKQRKKYKDQIFSIEDNKGIIFIDGTMQE